MCKNNVFFCNIDTLHHKKEKVKFFGKKNLVAGKTERNGSNKKSASPEEGA
jgi:hypothetical protein